MTEQQDFQKRMKRIETLVEGIQTAADPALRGRAVDHDRGADEVERRRRLRGLVQRHQGRQGVIRLHLLLDRREFDQLLGELVGVHRAERILVLQLRRQQRQKALKVARDLRGSQCARGRGRGAR